MITPRTGTSVRGHAIAPPNGRPSPAAYRWRAGADDREHARLEAERARLDRAAERGRRERVRALQGAGGAAALIRDALAADPGVPGTELGRRLGIAPQYATQVRRRVLAQIRAEETAAPAPVPEPVPERAQAAGTSPPPPARRCGSCGYLETAPGHRIACGGGQPWPAVKCLCSHPRHSIPGSIWEPCVRSCGCVRYRPDPRARRDPFAALELYPGWIAACPLCDSPYGTVHGPGCPLDPEAGKIAARGEMA